MLDPTAEMVGGAVGFPAARLVVLVVVVLGDALVLALVLDGLEEF